MGFFDSFWFSSGATTTSSSPSTFFVPQQISIPLIGTVSKKFRKHVTDCIEKNFPVFEKLKEFGQNGTYLLRLERLPLSWNKDIIAFGQRNTHKFTDLSEWNVKFEEKDPFKILGIDKKMSKEDIKRLYRKLAKECHPDTDTPDEKRFKEITEAFDKIGKRKMEIIEEIPKEVLKEIQEHSQNGKMNQRFAKLQQEIADDYLQSLCDYKPFYDYLRRRKLFGKVELEMEIEISWGNKTTAEIKRFEISKML